MEMADEVSQSRNEQVSGDETPKVPSNGAEPDGKSSADAVGDARVTDQERVCPLQTEAVPEQQARVHAEEGDPMLREEQARVDAEEVDPMLWEEQARVDAEEVDPMLREEQARVDAEEGDPMLREEVTSAATGCDDTTGRQTNHETGGRERHQWVADTAPVEVATQKCTKPPSSSCLSWDNFRKVLIGLTIGLSVAVSWVAATQFMKSMYSPTFNAPYFIIWFSTIWLVICYPIYVIGSMVLFKEKRAAGLMALFKEDTKIYGPAGLTLWHCLRLTGPFCALWMITNYMYAAALKLKAPTDVTALFVTNTAFIYVFSWIWLEEVLILLPARLFSVSLSIIGTVLMMYSDGFHGGSVIGVLLALGSAIGAALYKVLFKRFLGDATYGQVSLFLTMLALLNLVLLWPIVLALYYTETEVLQWDNLPWAFLCGVSALGIVFNFLVNFGIAITYPLLISLANIVGIPINAVIDTAFRDLPLGPWEIVGSLLILGGFVVMLLPESWQARAACWKEGEEPCLRRAQRLPDADQEEEEAQTVESV